MSRIFSKGIDEDTTKWILKLYYYGLSDVAIADRTDYSVSTIRKVLKRQGITRMNKKSKVEEEPDGSPVDCDIHGHKCKYKSSSSQYRCDYCSITGHIRGGSPNSCMAYYE